MTTPLNTLSNTERTILRILDERGGASVTYMQRTLRSAFDRIMPAPSIRRAIGTLRAKGYDITHGLETACDGRKLYNWVKSPVVVALPEAGIRLAGVLVEDDNIEELNELDGDY